jgi:hypothetical protein
MALEAWMRIGQPLEDVMNDYQRIFDAWEAGGVCGLVVGRLFFRADDAGSADYYRRGNVVPAFRPKPQAYYDRGMEPGQAEIDTDPTKEKILHAMLDNAKARGWCVLIFCPGPHTPAIRSLPLEEDPYGARATAAVWDEVFSAFPQVDGGIMDGWTEAAYELIYHHGNAVFADMTEQVKERARIQGYDAERLERGMRHLKARFQSLTPAQVQYYGDHGVLAAMNLFDINEEALYWLRWRRERSLQEGRAVRKELDRLPHRLLLGNGLRSAVFSGMTAVDFLAWDEILDLLLVKHYFWHRGFDGMYGTASRWVQQIHEWNPELSEQDCFTVAKAWLGVELPGISSLAEMDLGFPQAFFDQVVREETRRALAAVSDPRKVVPWVDTGRMPHAGDPMTSGDLHRILVASEEAGLERFLFHNHEHLTAAEWRVISRRCGTEWNEDPQGYWPPATPKPFTFG